MAFTDIIQSTQGAYLTISGKTYLNLCSNNYLGFAGDERLKKASIEAIQKYGVGTASVRALVGTNELHVELERLLAEFKGTEDAVVLTGGYLANMAAITTTVGKDDVVVSDELNHASIIDAVRLSGVQTKFIYKHADMADLRRQLPAISEAGKGKTILFITDGVFSMDGDIAPLAELVEIVEACGGVLMVDDAHGEGVLGKSGRGVVDHMGLHGKVDIEIGTLSKAFGVMGGFICGSKERIGKIRTSGRQFLFTNALSIPDTAGLIEAVKILMASDERVKALWSNTTFLKEAFVQAGCDIGHSQTPIIPLMIGDEALAKKCAQEAMEQGVMATPIVFPMVPQGMARLRIQPSAVHTQADLEKGVRVLVGVLKANGVV